MPASVEVSVTAILKGFTPDRRDLELRGFGEKLWLLVYVQLCAFTNVVILLLGCLRVV